MREEECFEDLCKFQSNLSAIEEYLDNTANEKLEQVVVDKCFYFISEVNRLVSVAINTTIPFIAPLFNEQLSEMSGGEDSLCFKK